MASRRARPQCASPLLAAALLALSLPVAAQTAAPNASARTGAVQSWDLPAGPLGSTLLAIAGQSGQTISVPPELVRGRNAPAVRGTFTAEQAALAAISGQALDLVRTENGTLSLRTRPAQAAGAGAAASATTLAPVQVTAQRETARSPVNGFVARRNASASKTDTSQLETPQVVNVITRDQITQQGANNTAEALRYTAGVLAEPNGFDVRYDWSFVRGYATYGTQWIDGLAFTGDPNTYAVPRLNSYAVDRIEVVKGPASVLYGKSLPGGMINQVTKRPQFEPRREVQFQTTTFGGTQIATDLTGPVSAGSDWAYRLVALKRNMQTRIDHERDEQLMIAPSLTWRPSAATQFTLLAHYQKEDPRISAPFYPSLGTLRPNPAGDISRSVHLGEPGSDYFNRTYKSLGYEFEHDVNDRVTVRQKLRVADAAQDMFLVRGNPGAALQPNGYVLNRVSAISDDRLKNLTIDTHVETRWQTGALRHTVLAGFDYQRSRSSLQFGSLAVGVPPLDLRNPVYGSPVPRPAAFGTSSHQDSRQLGIYLQDQIRYGSTIVTAGLRRDDSDIDSTNRISGAMVTTRDSATTGRMGVTHVFDNGVAPYASYSTSFRPTLGLDRVGGTFRPERSYQTEVGVKYEPASGWGLLTASVYKLSQSNVLTPDPVNTNFRVQSGEQQVRGLELEARLNLNARLDMLASYTYSDSEVTKANDTVVLGQQVLGLPRQQASVWANYRVAAVPGLETGAGARYTSSYTRALRYEPELRIPSTFLIDAAASYQLHHLSPELRGALLRLTVSNITDKRSVAYCQNLNGASCNYAAGRTVTATLSYQW